MNSGREEKIADVQAKVDRDRLHSRQPRQPPARSAGGLGRDLALFVGSLRPLGEGHPLLKLGKATGVGGVVGQDLRRHGGHSLRRS